MWTAGAALSLSDANLVCRSSQQSPAGGCVGIVDTATFGLRQIGACEPHCGLTDSNRLAACFQLQAAGGAQARISGLLDGPRSSARGAA
jgi:hypothetical protein